MKLAILALACLMLAACSPSAFGTHYQAITVLTSARSVGYSSITAARATELDTAEEAHPMRGPERDAALDSVATRWAPVGAALDGMLSALETWTASVMAARAADEDEDLLQPLATVVGRVAQLYADVVRLAGTLGVELPALPSFVTSLLGGL